MIPTMIIMPNNRKMTFQSIPSCSEKNTSAPGISPNTAITPAATSTTLTLFTFSVAMKKNATTKTVRARTPVIGRALAVPSGPGHEWRM
jgi:hypothetical protein